MESGKLREGKGWILNQVQDDVVLVRMTFCVQDDVVLVRVTC